MEKNLLNQQIIYSLIAMPLAIVGLPLYIYLPTFYASEIGIDIAIVGIILFCARLSDVLTDPFIGYLSDKSIRYFKTRKPLMVLGSIILIISFYFLINPNTNYPIFWLLFFSIFIYFGWSMVYIPYLTFSSEISHNYYIKTKLNSFREIAAVIGLILALLIPYLFNLSFIKDKLNLLFLFFILLYIPLFFFTMKSLVIKSLESFENFKLIDLKGIYKNNKNLRFLQIGYFFNNLANAVPATLFLLYVEIVLEDKNSSDGLLILYFLSGIIALPFWMILSKKIGKKQIWTFSILLACISFSFVIFLEKGDILYFAIISVVSGLSLGADIAFPTAIQSDIVQKQKNNSGLLFGIWSMITKLALAFSVVVSFGILGIVGFDKNNLTQSAILTLTLLYGVLPIILKTIALVFIKRINENN